MARAILENTATSVSWRTSTLGKTTTTERISITPASPIKIGEVHDGAATMDWMEQEQNAASRSRRPRPPASGRTIADQHHRHPGHVDFTIEVSVRSRPRRRGRRASTALRRGAAVRTVWRQADKVRRAADVLHQQAGPHRRELQYCVQSIIDRPRRNARGCCICRSAIEAISEGSRRSGPQPRDHLEGMNRWAPKYEEIPRRHGRRSRRISRNAGSNRAVEQDDDAMEKSSEGNEPGTSRRCAR